MSYYNPPPRGLQRDLEHLEELLERAHGWLDDHGYPGVVRTVEETSAGSCWTATDLGAAVLRDRRSAAA